MRLFLYLLTILVITASAFIMVLGNVFVEILFAVVYVIRCAPSRWYVMMLIRRMNGTGSTLSWRHCA